MAANAIININSDLTVISDMNSVFKSSADNSSSFANVFENVNKSYTEKNNETSANDVIASATSEKPKVDAIDNETKKAEDAPSVSNDVDTEKTITDNKNADSTSIKDTTENSNESEDKTKTTNEEPINPEKIIVSTEVEKALPSLIGVDILQVEPTQLIQKNLGDNSADKTTNIQVQAQQIVSNSKINLQKVDLKPSKITADADTDTQAVQGNLGDNSAGDTTNVQIQAQQVVPNSKIDSQKVDIQSTQITADKAKVTDNQTPMIKVDVQAIIANNTLNVGSNPQSSQNSKDVLDKATITQDMLNKTNAKVISVETSSSNQSSSQNSNSKQNNLLNKQNPEEQIIKLSLESNAASNNINVNVAPNISNISDTTLQTNFAKTVDNIQTPKELSHNDILSQINSKLDNLQTENLTKVNIVLKPENLGKINLELINSKEGLIAKMTTDNQQVKEILNKNLDGLKETLSNQGVNVNNVTVKIDETQKQSNDMFSFDNR
ncbi:MAG: flagellar hook-length control protein FliK [bacterium]